MKKPDLSRTLEYIRLLQTFQSVERVAHAPNLLRKENDVEHSYSLSMLCWYLCDALDLDLSRNKVIEYALCHDLVETYAGDTFIYDTEGQKTKREREEKARLRIQNEFPEFKHLHKTIVEYEQRTDKETLFVHAIDKLLPALINYVQGGHTWKEMNLDHDGLYANKREKIGDQKEARDLLEQLIVQIGNNWSTYFPK